MKTENEIRFKEAIQLKELGSLGASREILLDLYYANPTAFGVVVVLGEVCWEMGLMNEAVAYFEKGIEFRPESEAASLGLFHCLLEIGKNDEAFNEMRRFLTIADSDEYRRLLNDINRA
jgi:predicted Zn-dependent protease